MMSTALSVGQFIEVPGLDGRWQVWSKANSGPGAYFVVKEGRCATIRAKMKRGEAFPTIELLVEP